MLGRLHRGGGLPQPPFFPLGNIASAYEGNRGESKACRGKGAQIKLIEHSLSS